MKELLLAFLIFFIICFLLLLRQEQADDNAVILVVDDLNRSNANRLLSDSHGACGSILDQSSPYRAYDNCMASCGGCDAYQTEPVLREMIFFNNLYDKEHSYECDPVVLPPFARVYDA